MYRQKLSTDFYTKSINVNNVVEINIHTIPKLYKYQPITKYSLVNFENDEIWGSTPIAFNDPYDSAICYSQMKLKEAIRKNLSSAREQAYKKFFRVGNMKCLLDKLVSYIWNDELLRNQYIISCFSINNDSEIMWAHYADAARGFCLEYSGEELMGVAKRTSQNIIKRVEELIPFRIDTDIMKKIDKNYILPVLYVNKKINITDQIIELLPIGLEMLDLIAGLNLPHEILNIFSEDNINLILKKSLVNRLISQNILCRKNTDWKYEQEWRIFSYNEHCYFGSPHKSHMCIGNIVAQAVYLGEKMLPETRKDVIEIAQKKNIPIFEMKSKMLSRNFRLKSVPVIY